MPVDRMEITTRRDGTLCLERYGILMSPDEARRLIDNLERRLERLPPPPVVEETPEAGGRVAGAETRGSGA